MRVLFSIQTVGVVGLALLLTACGSDSVAWMDDMLMMHPPCFCSIITLAAAREQ